MTKQNKKRRGAKAGIVAGVLFFLANCVTPIIREEKVKPQTRPVEEAVKTINYNNIDWKSDFSQIGRQGFLKREVLYVDDSAGVLTRYTDVEGKRRGFITYDFQTDGGKIIIYDFEMNGNVFDKKRPDKNGLVDAIITLGMFKITPMLPNKYNKPVYEEGTKRVKDAYKAYSIKMQQVYKIKKRVYRKVFC